MGRRSAKELAGNGIRNYYPHPVLVRRGEREAMMQLIIFLLAFTVAILNAYIIGYNKGLKHSYRATYDMGKPETGMISDIQIYGNKIIKNEVGP
jgi:hypothetical protein